MRILGIDPGSQATGYGIIEGPPGALVHVDHGVLRMPRGAPLYERLGRIHRGVAGVLEHHRPELAVVERTFVAASARSALVLGEARGAAVSAIGSAGLPVAEYSAREIKQAITGQGGAAKREVQRMVQRLLGLAEDPPSDAADALAAAICHVHREAVPAAMRGTRPRRSRGRRSPRFVVRGAP